jgi:hypothetical protein
MDLPKDVSDWIPENSAISLAMQVFLQLRPWKMLSRTDGKPVPGDHVRH